MEKLRAGLQVARDGARLHIGDPLPGLGRALEVFEVRAGGLHQLALASGGPQASIDGEERSFAGVGGEDVDHAAGDTGPEEMFGGVLVGKHEHQVRVGAEIEFAHAQPAEGDHQQLLRGRVAGRLRRLRRQGVVESRLVSRLNHAIGELRGFFERLEHRPGAADAIGEDPEDAAAVDDAQRRGVAGGLHVARRAQFRQQVREADQLFAEIAAVVENVEDLGGERVILVQRFEPVRGQGNAVEEMLERPLPQAEVRRRDGGRQARRALIERAHQVPAGGARFGGRGGRGVLRALLRVHDAIVDLGDFQEMAGKVGEQPTAVAPRRGAILGHQARQAVEIRRGVGQRVGLPVFIELQPVLEVPQELVRRGQAPVLGVREPLLVVQTGQGEQRAAMAHPRFAAAMQPLQALDQKLDVADAAAVQLDVHRGGFALKLAARKLFVQAFAGGAHGFDGAEVERRRIGEWLHEVEQFAAELTVARGHAGFDQHLELPIPGARLVVLLHAVEREADFAQAAFGAEAEVHAIAEPFGGVRGKELGELIGDALIELLVGDRRRAGGVAVGGVEEHQVDVGAVVQLRGAVLAERDDGEAALPAVRLRRAELGDEGRPDPPVREVDDNVRHQRKLGGDLRERRVAQDIADQHAQDLPAAELRQHQGTRHAGPGGQGELLEHRLLLQREMQVAAGNEGGQPVRVLHDFFGKKPAVRRHGEQAGERQGRNEQRIDRPRARGVQRGDSGQRRGGVRTGAEPRFEDRLELRRDAAFELGQFPLRPRGIAERNAGQHAQADSPAFSIGSPGRMRPGSSTAA